MRATPTNHWPGPATSGGTAHMQAVLPGRWGATRTARRPTWSGPADPIIPGLSSAPNCRCISRPSVVAPALDRAPQLNTSSSLSFHEISPGRPMHTPRVVGADCRVFCMADLVAGASDRRTAAGIFGRPRVSTCSCEFIGYITRVLVYGINYRLSIFV
jgi:hypothetical protein